MQNAHMKKFTILAVLLLSSCATTEKFGAADDILEFASGLQNNNAPMIERHLDRQSLRNQAQSIARDVAYAQISKQMGDGFGAQIAAAAAADLAKPLINTIADEALSTQNLSYFAQKAGLNRNLQLPSRFKAGLALQALDETRVCVPDDDTKKCVLYFGRYPDAWKLYAIDEQALRKRLEKFKK